MHHNSITMAKKARTRSTKGSTATAAPAAKQAATSRKVDARKKKAKGKKTSGKKEKKARHAAIEKQVIAAVEQFHKDTSLLGAYSRQFFDSLRKSGVDLPAKSRKALG